MVGRFVLAHHTIRAGTIGVFLMLAGFMNLAQIPHPIWFAVLSTISFIPMTLLGAKVGLKGNKEAAAASE